MEPRNLTEDERQEMMIHALREVCPRREELNAWHFITGQPGLTAYLHENDIQNPEEVIDFMDLRASMETVIKATLCSERTMSDPDDVRTAIGRGIKAANVMIRERDDGIRIYGVDDPEMPGGRAGVAAISPGGDICGIYLESNLIVDPAWRRRGLACDLIVDCVLHMGGLPGWKSPEPLYSEAGLRAHHQAWSAIEAGFDLTPLRDQDILPEP